MNREETTTQNWELICTNCLSGLLVSDEKLGEMLKDRSGDRWPKHCGKTMQLRKPLSERSKKPCSHRGCTSATHGVCGCNCAGKYHGVNNPNINFTKITLPWYNQKIRQYLSLPL